MVKLDDLRSDEYRNLPNLSFAERHDPAMRAKYGVWRWNSIQAHKDAILAAVLHADGRPVMDFGGALAPLGFGSMVVDELTTDIWDRPTLKECDTDAWCYFSSHTLEHTDDPIGIVERWRADLPRGGYIILNLPSDKAYEHWHPQYKAAHKWLFTMDINKHGTDQMIWAPLLIKDLMPVYNGYSGDQCIFLMARKYA